MTAEQRRPDCREGGAPPEPGPLDNQPTRCDRCPYDPDQLGAFARRVVQDALNEATSAYWSGRAETFEAAGSRSGDFTGSSTAEDRIARDARLVARARACRAAADLARTGEYP